MLLEGGAGYGLMDDAAVDTHEAMIRYLYKRYAKLQKIPPAQIPIKKNLPENHFSDKIGKIAFKWFIYTLTIYLLAFT